MKHRFFLTALSALLLSSGSLMAAEKAKKYSVYAGLWNQRYSGQLIDEDGPQNVESQLAIENNPNAEVGIVWLGQNGWIPNVRLSLFQIQSSGSNVISEQGEFGILGIPVVTATGSAQVDTDIKYLIWSSNAFYGFDWRGIDLKVGAALNFVDGTIVADVDYDATAEGAGRVDERRRDNTRTLIPTAFGSASKVLNHWLSVHVNLYGASTGTDGVGQVSLALEAEWDYNLTLIGGYRSQSIDFYDEDKDTGLDVTIEGLFGGVRYNF